jgi:hypothetical protein
MSLIQKPSIKTAGSVAMKAVSVGIGVKLADGASAIMPASTNSYKNYILAALGLGLAACVNTTSDTGKNAQLALLGFGGKPIYDEITNRTKDAVAPQDPTTVMGKFFNAVIGHKDTTEALGNSTDVQWIPNDAPIADMWERAGAQEVAFTGV